MNCTQTDLEAIVTNNPELYLNGSISSLKYGTKYRYLPIISTDYRFFALDTIVPPLVNSSKWPMELFSQTQSSVVKLTKHGVPLFIRVNVILLFSKYFILNLWLIDSRCVDPPTPPEDNNLSLQGYDQNNPPWHGDTVQYCCSAGGWNRFENDFSQSCISLTCLTNNIFSSVSWPQCLHGRLNIFTENFIN